MDTAKFDRALRQHKDAIYRQMLRVCHHREDAEDALATALLLAYQSADRLRSEEAFTGWVKTIGNRVCTRMRHHPSFGKVTALAEELELGDPAPDPFDAHLLKACVLDAIESLSPEYRAVYMACELEERTVPEVAAELEITVAAAKSRLLRARASVRTRLDSSVCGGITESSPHAS